ncbi:MAG TPA: cache domain-containing protein [Bryobacteraceae bacterium]|nr:cache domain-containing protein [Bryobacteraceae bacterium]
MRHFAPAHGAGPGQYLWPKISYVKLYPTWGWIVGAGIYVDDVEGMLHKSRSFVLIVSGLGLVASLLLAYFMARSLSAPVRRATANLAQFTEQSALAVEHLSSASQSIAAGTSQQAALRRSDWQLDQQQRTGRHHQRQTGGRLQRHRRANRGRQKRTGPDCGFFPCRDRWHRPDQLGHLGNQFRHTGAGFHIRGDGSAAEQLRARTGSLRQLTVELHEPVEGASAKPQSPKLLTYVTK